MKELKEFIHWFTTSNLPLIILAAIFYFKNKKEILASFYNDANGFSARKLTGFASVVIAIKLSITYTTTAIFYEVLLAWMVFYSLNAGLITFQQFLEFKNGKKE